MIEKSFRLDIDIAMEHPAVSDLPTFAPVSAFSMVAEAAEVECFWDLAHYVRHWYVGIVERFASMMNDVDCEGCKGLQRVCERCPERSMEMSAM